MKHTALIVLAFFVAFAASCAATGDTSQDQAQCLSVDEALASIASANGAEVSVCGWLRYEAEDKNLYNSASDRWEDSDDHCLSLGRGHGFTEDLAPLSGRRVRVTGVATSSFCPADAICMASCSESGIFAQSVEPL